MDEDRPPGRDRRAGGRRLSGPDPGDLLPLPLRRLRSQALHRARPPRRRGGRRPPDGLSRLSARSVPPEGSARTWEKEYIPLSMRRLLLTTALLLAGIAHAAPGRAVEPRPPVRVVAPAPGTELAAGALAMLE